MLSIHYPAQDPSTVIARIEDRLAHQNLNSAISIQLQGKSLKVTIAKLGTSKLSFKGTVNQEELRWQLIDEDIAWGHRLYRQKMLKKLQKIVEATGGEIKL